MSPTFAAEHFNEARPWMEAAMGDLIQGVGLLTTCSGRSRAGGRNLIWLAPEGELSRSGSRVIKVPAGRLKPYTEMGKLQPSRCCWNISPCKYGPTIRDDGICSPRGGLHGFEYPPHLSSKGVWNKCVFSACSEAYEEGAICTPGRGDSISMEPPPRRPPLFTFLAAGGALESHPACSSRAAGPVIWMNFLLLAGCD